MAHLEALLAQPPGLPEPLAQAALGALEHWMTQMGLHPVGSIDSLRHELARTVDAEARKHDLVLAHTQGASAARQLSLLTGYLSTKPAPLFARRIAAAYPALWPQAKAAWHARQNLTHLPHRSTLFKALGALDQADPGQVASWLWSHAAEFDRFEIERILDQGTPEGILLMAAIAGVHGAESLSQPLLHRVMFAPDEVIPLAVIAAHLSPQAASQAFSLMLVETVMGNPEDPHNLWTPALARTTIVVRSLLPWLGSPIPEVTLDPAHPDAPLLEQVRQATWGAWHVWGGVLEAITSLRKSGS